MNVIELDCSGYHNFLFFPAKKSNELGLFLNELDCCDNHNFFFPHRFNLVKDHLIEFNQLAMANAEGSDDMLNRVMTKDNIGLAAMLETKEGAYETGETPSVTCVREKLLLQWCSG